MIWQRIPIIRSFFGLQSGPAADVAARWQKAFARDPVLADDVIRLSGVLELQPVEMIDGHPNPLPIDPYRLAYEAGRRDLALLLLAQGHISSHELNQLMESLDVH